MCMSHRLAASGGLQLCVCAAVICGTSLLVGTGMAAGQPGKASANTTSHVAADGWSEVNPSERVAVLEMIADQARGNYERIRTWEGTFAVSLQQLLGREFVAEALGRGSPAKDAVLLVQEFVYSVRVAIDMNTGNVFRDKETSRMTFFKEGTREIVIIPSASASDHRSVVTSEHYVHFPPKTVWPAFAMLPNHPKAQKKPAAFREPREQSEGLGFGDLMDPRDFFGFSATMRSWDELGLFIRAMRGENGEETKRMASERVVLYKGAGPGGPQYRLDAKLKSHRGSDDYFMAIWSAGAGFNPVKYVLSADPLGKQPLRTLEWRWGQFDGVYLPAWFREANYVRDGGKLSHQREVTLEQCSLNQPLDSHQFDYQGLGLRDGDLVVDNIEKAMRVMKDGEAVKLANFGEEYVPPGTMGQSLPKRWVFVAGASLLVLLLIAAHTASRYRRRPE